MLANTLKTAAVAALLGLGIAGTSGTVASAYSMRTRCDGDDCVRLQCNDFGYDCFRVGAVERYDYDQPYSYRTRTYTYYPYDYDTYRDYDTDHYYPNYDYDYDNDYDDYDYPG